MKGKSTSVPSLRELPIGERQRDGRRKVLPEQIVEEPETACVNDSGMTAVNFVRRL